MLAYDLGNEVTNNARSIMFTYQPEKKFQYNC